MKMIKHYTVKADAVTGEWIGEAEYTGELVDWNEHLMRADTESEHFDTYQAPVLDSTGWDTGMTETRAVTVEWVY